MSQVKKHTIRAKDISSIRLIYDKDGTHIIWKQATTTMDIPIDVRTFIFILVTVDLTIRK